MRSDKRVVMSPKLRRLAEFVMSETLGPNFLTTLRHIERALEGVEHVLIGGQAVYFSGYERFSKDIDIGVIRPIRGLAPLLLRAGFKHLRAARFVHPETEIEVDLVKLPRCTIPYVKRPRTAAAAPDLSVPMIDLAPLLALKVKTGRIQDEADVVELLKAKAVPDRLEVVRLLKRLGETAESYDRLVARAEQEGPRE